MIKDVSYYTNLHLPTYFPTNTPLCINCSVEESTVGERTNATGGLLPHDLFIRDNCTAEDVVVLSVGGNDVALKPTAGTIAAIFALTRTPLWALKMLGRWSPGFGYMERLLHGEVERMVARLCEAPTPPARVIVCMIYFLDEMPGGSWADDVLGKLGYDTNPDKLQYIIRTLYSRISSLGFAVPSATTVTPFPLFEVLDGKDTDDYEQRVEPSMQGGEKMAKAFLELLSR